jgi:hypothetical protein
LIYIIVKIVLMVLGPPFIIDLLKF